MNQCSKTGARILVKPYDYVVAADIYDHGCFVVIRYNNQSKSYDVTDIMRASHIVDTDPHTTWLHDEAGVIVVLPRYLVTR